MEKNIFENISPQKENMPHKKDESQMTRRQFLARAGMFAAAGASIASSDILQYLSKKEIPKKHKDIQPDIEKENTIALVKTPETSKELTNITQQETDIIGKTFAEQIRTQDTITLDDATRNAIYHKWHEKYKPGGENYDKGLVAGLERMHQWHDEIRQQFIQEGVPEEYMYLAIAESHFSTDAISQKKAVGTYQITKSTSQLKTLGAPLIITDYYDERRDPVASAGLCARHLKYSYEKFNHDWDLALMDYNGGITNLYLESISSDEKKADIHVRGIHTLTKGETLSHLAEHYNTSITLLKKANDITDETAQELQIGRTIIIPQERIAISFDHFNTWLENHINAKIREESVKSKYIVQAGDTTSAIAQKFGMDRSLLESINNISDHLIRAGQELHIPDLFNKKKDRILAILSDYQQNINYPGKFKAIYDVIRENNLDKKIALHKKRQFKKVKVPHINPVIQNYTIKSGETITTIAHNIATNLKSRYANFDKSSATITQLIIQQNKDIKDPRKIQVGQEILLRIPIERPPTLYDIAKKNQLPVEQFITANPAITNPHSEIPTNVTIRK